MSFASRQQLAVHQFRLHGIRAIERSYAQSHVCPGRLTTFHSTYRVIQHLRYRPNRCWERVHGVKKPEEPGNVQIPAHLRGVHRLPAQRIHHGPLRPTAHQRERQRVRSAIAELEKEGAEDSAWWDPSTGRDLTLRCCRQEFEMCLSSWFAQVKPTEALFRNMFFNTIFNLNIPEFGRTHIYSLDRD